MPSIPANSVKCFGIRRKTSVDSVKVKGMAKITPIKLAPATIPQANVSPRCRAVFLDSEVC